MQDFSLTFFLRQEWLDRRLAFNYTNINLELDQTSIKEVWTPDTYIQESKIGALHQITKPNTLLHILSNGTVKYSMRFE